MLACVSSANYGGVAREPSRGQRENQQMSFTVATLPIIAVLITLGVLQRAAWEAALAGLIIGLIIAITVWQMPSDRGRQAVANASQ